MKEEADYQRVLAQGRHFVEGYPMVVTRCAKYGKPARTVPDTVDDMGTPVAADGFDGEGGVDAASGNEFVDEDTRTPQLDKESSV